MAAWARYIIGIWVPKYISEALKVGRLPAERLDFDTLSRNNLACSSGYIGTYTLQSFKLPIDVLATSKLDSHVLIGIGNCAMLPQTSTYIRDGQPASLSINHRPPFPLTHLRRIPLTNVLLALSLWGYGSIVGVLSTSSNHHRYHLSSRRH